MSSTYALFHFVLKMSYTLDAFCHLCNIIAYSAIKCNFIYIFIFCREDFSEFKHTVEFAYNELGRAIKTGSVYPMFVINDLRLVMIGR